MKRNLSLFYVLIFVLSLCLSACGQNQKSTLPLAPSTEGMVIEKESLCFVSAEGKKLELSGDFSEGYLSQDGKHMLGLRTDNVLVLSGSDGKAEEISQDVSSIAAVGNECVFYYIKLGGLRRYTYSDQSTISISGPKTANFKYSQNHSAILWVDDDGALFSLSIGDDAPVPVPRDGAQGAALPLAISNSGRACVYTVLAGNNRSFFHAADGEATLLGTVSKKKLENNIVYFSPDEKELVLAIENASSLFLYKKDGTAEAVELNGNLSPSISSEKGPLSEQFSLSSLYFVLKDSRDIRCLYHLDKDRNLTKVITGIAQWELRGGKLYYRTPEFLLYCASIQNGEVGDMKKIDSDICFFDVALDGSAVFYISLASNKGVFVGDLYCAEFGKEPVRLARQGNILTVMISTDSRHYAFVGNAEPLPNCVLDTCGDLYYGKIGEAPEKIDTEVVSLFAQYASSHFYADGFSYSKLLIQKDGLCSRSYFDGKKTQLLVSDYFEKLH